MDYVWIADPTVAEVGYQRHLLQVQFLDTLVAQLLQRLRSEGLFDRALVVVTVDHGVSFRGGSDRRAVKRSNFADIASVPLFVKLPGQQTGRTDNRLARTIDILPTVADALRVRLPWPVDGRSLLRPARTVSRITVGRRDGSRVTESAAFFHQALTAAVRRKTRLFGTGRRPLFGLGPEAGISPAYRERRGERRADRCAVRERRAFRDVDPSSGLVPSYVAGTVDGVRAGTPLAVTINGVIQGTSRVWQDGSSRRFGALVRPTGFRPGGQCRERLRGPRHRQRHSPRAARLDTDSRPALPTRRRRQGGAPRRRARDPRADALGSRRILSSSPTTFRFGGWAIDDARRSAAERVLVFAGRRAVYDTPTGMQYWELPEGLRQAGFAVELPRSIVGDASSLRVFALDGRHAVELDYAKDFPWRPGK